MPIQIPNDLPAAEILHNENIFVMKQTRADTQHIRPLEIVLLNLMPTKIVTETQLSRLLGNTPLQVHLELMMVSSHRSKNTPQEHLLTFYKTFDELKDRKFDGMIITGAPVEQMPFEEVDYWPELCRIMAWSKTNVHSTFHICWGAQAGLYYHYGIQKYPLPQKLFGVYPHHLDYKRAILLRGFDDEFWVPHSRHTTIHRADIEMVPGLKILASSPEAGVYAVMSKEGRQIFVTGHSEYDADTLEKEYLRDKNQGLPIHVPVNYYPDDDDTKAPIVRWRGHAHLLFSNWLNYFVYQTTPYDLMAVGSESTEQVELYSPKREDLWFRQKMLSDPDTMFYNKDWDVTWDGYHRDTGCIDFPEEEWTGFLKYWENQEPNRFYAYIQRCSDGAWIGEVDFHYTPEKDWWDMGIVIYAPYRGKGYAVPALKLMLDHAFRDCGISRVHNDFELARNEVSAWETHRKAGFQDLEAENGFLQMMITKEDYLRDNS